MKTISKKLMLLMVMAVLCFAMALTAGAATTEDGFTYTVSNGEVTITGYEGTSTKLVMPDEIDGCPVTWINYQAFNGRSDFTGDLIIPESVRVIANGAFYGCSGFTGDLIIPESVKIIGDAAFYGCSGFTGDLIIPKGVTSIGSRAFYDCSGFTGDLIIPENVTSINSDAFYNCSGFTGRLVIPEGVTNIADRAFNRCSGFTGELIIPESVTKIGGYAFYGCKGFTGNLIIPEGLTSIQDGTFGDCRGLTGELIIPAGVTYIGESAFWQCEGFTGDLIIPEGVTEIRGYTFSGCSGFIGDLRIPEGVTSIGTSAFNSCTGFTGELVIPNSVTSIGARAFYVYKFSHIAYESDETQWNSITNDEYGVGFSNDKIHFNFNPETDITESITASTCLTEGSKTTVCSCGYTYGTENLPLADCSFTAYASDNNATCTADGTKTAYCDYSCGKKNTITDEGSALGHAMGEFVITKEATCTVNGEERADCSRCDYFETRELVANNHKDENLDGTCEYCNKYIANKNCICICHAKTIGALVYKIFKAIDKAFGTDLVRGVFGIADICTCGIKH